MSAAHEEEVAKKNIEKEPLVIEIKEEVLKQKMKNPNMLRLSRKAEKDAKYNIDLFEFLFGEDETTKLFEQCETYEELNDFLVPVMEQINSYIASSK